MINLPKFVLAVLIVAAEYYGPHFVQIRYISVSAGAANVQDCQSSMNRRASSIHLYSRDGQPGQRGWSDCHNWALASICAAAPRAAHCAPMSPPPSPHACTGFAPSAWGRLAPICCDTVTAHLGHHTLSFPLKGLRGICELNASTERAHR